MSDTLIVELCVSTYLVFIQQSKPFFEFKGSGKIVFDDGLSADVNFIIKTLQNGKTVGNLDSISFHFLIDNHFRQTKKFSLHGKWNDNNGNIIATGCYLSSLSSQENIQDSKMTIVMAKGEFQTDYVLFFPEAISMLSYEFLNRDVTPDFLCVD